MYESFEKLDVWKRSAALAVRVYQILKDCRDFGLRDQMTLSAVSVPSNIAEGASVIQKKSLPGFYIFQRVQLPSSGLKHI